jgi:hypothetical protein
MVVWCETQCGRLGCCHRQSPMAVLSIGEMLSSEKSNFCWRMCADGIQRLSKDHEVGWRVENVVFVIILTHAVYGVVCAGVILGYRDAVNNHSELMLCGARCWNAWDNYAR